MLQAIRRGSRSWFGIILAVILIPPFAVVGVDYIFRGGLTRSAAGSAILRPPATFKKTSWRPKSSPQRASRTASNMERRAPSQPTTARLGAASVDGETSA